MGNTFTYYQGNNQFNITATDNKLYAFAIINSNLSLSDITVNTSWVASEYQVDTYTYNLLFKHEPGSIPTSSNFTNKLVFTSSSSLDTGLNAEWITDITNSIDISSTPVFSEPYQSFPIANEVGSGGGDPHIIPLYNPQKVVYLLPTDDKCYRYFDTLNSNNVRLIVNAKMWIISNIYIDKLERLIKTNQIQKYHEKRKYIEFPTELTPLETSFMRYINFYTIYKNNTQKITFDMETLDFTGKSDHISVSELLVTKNSIQYPGMKNVKPNREWDRNRIITFNSKTFGNIYFKVYLTPMRPNHRNHIDIMTDKTQNIINKCFGCLINIDHVRTCDNKETDFPESLDKVNNIRTIREYTQSARDWRRNNRRKFKKLLKQSF